jgi:hypothetical protein
MRDTRDPSVPRRLADPINSNFFASLGVLRALRGVAVPSLKNVLHVPVALTAGTKVVYGGGSGTRPYRAPRHPTTIHLPK